MQTSIRQINNQSLFFRFWPFIFILFIWFIFSAPYFIKHKVPYSSTYQANFFAPWTPYHIYDGPIKNEAMPDIINQIYPWKYFTMQTIKQGSIPLWNPYSFSGTLHLANYQSAVLTPFNILFIFLPFIDAWSLLVLLQPLLAGTFMYLFMRSLNARKPGSLISAIGFMFCGFITTWMGYATLGYAFLFLPLALFAIEKYYQSFAFRYLFLFMICIPLSFFSGHFQISIYFFISIIIYILYTLFISRKYRKTRHTLSLLLSLFMGLLLSMPQVLPSVEAYGQSFRSSLFQKAEVIPWAYVITLLSPDFYGNPVTRNDWFGHYAEWNGYIGLLPILLAGYAILRKKNSGVIFFFIISIVSLLLALPTPLLDITIALHIPVLSTSAASRIIIIFSFFMLVLSGFGFDQLLHDVTERKLRMLFIWLGISSVIFIGLWVVVLGKLFLPVDKVVIAKTNLIFPTALFFLNCFVFGAFILSTTKKLEITHFIHKDKLQKSFIVLIPFILLLITSMDMLRFATKWQPFDPKQLVFPSTSLNQFLLTIPRQERAYGNYQAEESVYYERPSIEGYDTLYIKRYGEFIAYLANGAVGESNRSVVELPKNGRYTPEAINLLSITYIIHKISDGHNIWTFPFWNYPKDQFRLVYADNAYQVYKNESAFPRTFLAGSYVVKTNEQSILSTLFNPAFDKRNTLVLEEDPHIHLQNKSTGTAKIIAYKANTLTISVNTSSSSLLFLSDTYYPGWHAEVDGKESPIYRADYTFRSIVVPQGKHMVSFIYRPFSFMLGIYLAIIGVCGMFGLLLVSKKKIQRG